MNVSVVIAAVIADLHQEIVTLRAERDDLAAQCADLRKHLAECPANRDDD